MDTTQTTIGKRPKNLATAIMIVLIVVALFSLLFVRLAEKSPVYGHEVGDIAPDFSLVDTSNVPRTLDSFLAYSKPVLIEFVHPNASVCLSIGPSMDALQTDYGGNVTIVTIAVAVVPGDPHLGQPTIEKTRLMRQQLGSSWTYLVEISGTKVRDAYVVDGVPMFYLLGSDGKVVYLSKGAAGIPALRAAIDHELHP